jgi:hypothetical protein
LQDRKGHLKRGLREREIPNFAYLTLSPKGSAHRAVLPSGRYLRPVRFKGPPIQVRAAAFGLGGHDPRSVTTVVRQQESALLLARRLGILLHLFPAMAGFAPPLLSCSQAVWPRSLTLGSSGTGGVLQPPIRSPATLYEGFSLEIARSLAIKGEFVCRPIFDMGQPRGDRALRFSANAYQAGSRTSKR